MHRKGPEILLSQSQTSLSNPDKPAPTFEVFTSILESFEAKKKCVNCLLTMIPSHISIDIICPPPLKCCRLLTRVFAIASLRMGRLYDDTRNPRSDGVVLKSALPELIRRWRQYESCCLLVILQVRTARAQLPLRKVTLSLLQVAERTREHPALLAHSRGLCLLSVS